MEFEVGEGFSVDIIQEIDGFGFSYQLEPDEVPSREGLTQLIIKIKEVMKEFDLEQPSYFILDLLPPNRWVEKASFNVDKQKQIFIIRLPIYPTNHKPRIRDKHDVYHEFIHIKDVLDGRFPSIGLGNRFLKIINVFWDSSIEGRLVRMGKSNVKRENKVKELSACLRRLYRISREQSQKLVDEM